MTQVVCIENGESKKLKFSVAYNIISYSEDETKIQIQEVETGTVIEEFFNINNFNIIKIKDGVQSFNRKQ